MDLVDLRISLHEAVDRLLDQYEAVSRGQAEDERAPATPRGARVTSTEDNGPWTYRWPSGGTEAFSSSRWFEVADAGRRHRVLLARTERPAWGRKDRKRAIIFGQVGDPSSPTFYPWTEFVESDDGRYAAPIPKPARPRAMLSDGDALPDALATGNVERSDRLFAGIANGPSLRLVVGEHDEDAMVRHGYWVASLRNRV